jgi:SNF2 family DNA or RNA helicase
MLINKIPRADHASMHVCQILKIYNINALTLNGTHTVDERNDIIHQFNTKPEARVLLFSTVGAVGLNLTIATVVILFVSPQRSCAMTFGN